MSTSENAIREAIGEWTEPHLDCDLITAKAIRDISINADTVSVAVELGFPAASIEEEIRTALVARIEALDGVGKAVVTVNSKIITHQVQQGLKPLAGIGNVIVVASGKGGVGKSTTTANLALALRAEGARVGVLDADIYGPSQPRMFGLSGRPQSPDGKRLQPMENYGIKVMSIGFLIDEDTPMIWRGPMVTGALEQLLTETLWGDLDYLIVDLPPGTGDIQLTLSQKIPVSGAVIVTTPQDIALLDARKGLKMFEKVKIPILGIVENMSVHVCSACGQVEPIFGSGGGEKMCADYSVPFLGALPLELDIRERADMGCPTVVGAADSEAARRYREIARRTAAKLSREAKDFAGRFPKIVIQNT